MSLIELPPSWRFVRPVSSLSGADVGDRAVPEIEVRQAGEPTHRADVGEGKVALEVERRQAREPAQRTDVGDRVEAEPEAPSGL